MNGKMRCEAVVGKGSPPKAFYLVQSGINAVQLFSLLQKLGRLKNAWQHCVHLQTIGISLLISTRTRAAWQYSLNQTSWTSLRTPIWILVGLKLKRVESADLPFLDIAGICIFMSSTFILVIRKLNGITSESWQTVSIRTCTTLLRAISILSILTWTVMSKNLGRGLWVMIRLSCTSGIAVLRRWGSTSGSKTNTLVKRASAFRASTECTLQCLVFSTWYRTFTARPWKSLLDCLTIFLCLLGLGKKFVKVRISSRIGLLITLGLLMNFIRNLSTG